MKINLSHPLYFLLLLAFTVLSCKKSGSVADGPEDTAKKEQEAKQARAEHNDGQLSGMGNVYIAESLQPGAARQLYARAEYGGDNLAYYVSPGADADPGTDHRVVYGSAGDWRVLEFDEDGHSFRFYTEHGGEKSPLLLHAVRHGADQSELKLFGMDWQSGERQLVASVFLRDGEAVGRYKLAAAGGGTAVSATPSAGPAGCQHPGKQPTAAATIGAYLDYLHCFLSPLLQDGGGAPALFESLAGSPETAQHYATLLQDLGDVNGMLGKAGGVFDSFQTDPLPPDDAMKGFQWYEGTAGDGISVADVRLAVDAKSSSLTYDETDADRGITLVLQVEDKDGKAVTDHPAFVDFRVELERDGEVQLLVEETRSSDKENGQVEFNYTPGANDAVYPQVGDRLSVHYRLSAADDGGFQTQPVAIADRQPSRITIVSGNGQEADWKEKLKAPLVVKVTNKAGEVLESIPLKWTVQSESWGTIVGSLMDTQSVTDEKGLAQTDYTVGMQQEQPEKVLVQVLDKDGQPIPGLETTFTYKVKRKNYSIVLMKPLSNQYENGEMEEWKEWKNGANVKVDYGKLYYYRIKLDGEFIKYPNGDFVLLNFNASHFNESPTLFPFQADDIFLSDYPFIFSDPRSGFIDSIVVNLTVNNESYRTFIGKTIIWEGQDPYSFKNYEETFTFINGNKVTYKSKGEGFSTVESDVDSYVAIPSHVAVWSCDSKSFTMKEPVASITISGIISFLIFNDGKLLTVDIGVDSYQCGRINRKLPTFK